MITLFLVALSKFHVKLSMLYELTINIRQNSVCSNQHTIFLYYVQCNLASGTCINYVLLQEKTRTRFKLKTQETWKKLATCWIVLLSSMCLINITLKWRFVWNFIILSMVYGYWWFLVEVPTVYIRIYSHICLAKHSGCLIWDSVNS